MLLLIKFKEVMQSDRLKLNTFVNVILFNVLALIQSID